MNQGRGLERLAGVLEGQAARRQASKFVVDLWQEVASGLAIPLADGSENPGDFGAIGLDGRGPFRQ